jgi:site-specific recombinase XerD
MVMRGIARERTEPPVRKTALEADAIKALVATLPVGSDGELTLTGLRDRAILLVGFAGAFRRSELVALDVCDLEFAAEGLAIAIRRSKTDPEGKGRVKAIRRGGIYCPVAALHLWLEAGEIAAGPVFRWVRRGGNVTNQRLTPESVARIVRRYAAAAGLEGDFAAHSLRAGFVTTARKNGAELEDVMAVTHHRAVQTVQGYFRDADRFRANPLAGIF